MRKIVLTFGLIAGGILSIMMVLSLGLFNDRIDFDTGEVIGYSTMVLAFLMVFFGIRAYRDTVTGGKVSFGRAFQVGILITAIASVCYVATWQVVHRTMFPDFTEKYTAHAIEKARAAGESEAQIAERQATMARYAELYRNPLINVALTFLEPLPVGLIFTLVSAGVLSRRRKSEGEGEGQLASA